MNQFNSLWTDELRSEVKDLWQSLSASQIAQILSGRLGRTITRNSIIGIVQRMGLTRSDAKTRVPNRKKKTEPRKSKPQLRLVGGSSSGKSRLIQFDAPEVQLRCVEVVPQHASINDLAGCKYPYGDGPFTFCNHPRLGGSSYCGPHHHLCRERPRVEIHKLAGVAA